MPVLLYPADHCERALVMYSWHGDIVPTMTHSPVLFEILDMSPLLARSKASQETKPAKQVAEKSLILSRVSRQQADFLVRVCLTHCKS